MPVKSFPYSPYDRTHPKGSNSLGSQAMYYQRALYNEAVYPQSSPRPLDTWYGKIYYGKVDRNQVVVMPRSNSLAAIRSSARYNFRSNIVVASLFENFVTHMRQASIVGALSEEGNNHLFDLKTYAAYSDPNAQYQKYLERLHSAFEGSLSGLQKNKIHDFASYIKEMSSYLKQLAGFSPVTKTTFVLTPLNSRFASGLSISVAKGEADEDAAKYRKFISDPNFNFYSTCAKKYGFIVDKNSPWVLTADLFTDAFLTPLKRFRDHDYNILTKDNFFSTFYEPVCETDIIDLKYFIINSYNLFVANNPILDIIDYRCVGRQADQLSPMKVDLLERTAVPSGADNAAATDQILTDKYLIDLYIDLRYIESKEPFRMHDGLSVAANSAYRVQQQEKLAHGTGSGIISPLASAAHVVAAAFRPYLYDESYFKFANLNSLNLMVLGVDTENRSANITSGTSTSSPY